MIYEFPAIIKYEPQDNIYYVDFPDITGCFTDGKTLHEALNNAEDALSTMLSFYESKCVTIPTASKMNAIHLKAGEIITLVQTETEYSKIAV